MPKNKHFSINSKNNLFYDSFIISIGVRGRLPEKWGLLEYWSEVTCRIPENISLRWKAGDRELEERPIANLCPEGDRPLARSEAAMVIMVVSLFMSDRSSLKRSSSSTSIRYVGLIVG